MKQVENVQQWVAYCNFTHLLAMKRFSIIVIFLFSTLNLSAQEKDSLRVRTRTTEPSFFSTTDTITTNDYLLSIEKVFQVLNKTAVLSQPVPAIEEINNRLNEDDSTIAIINERLNSNSKMLEHS